MRLGSVIPLLSFLVFALGLAPHGLASGQNANGKSPGVEPHTSDSGLYLEASLDRLKKEVPILTGLRPDAGQESLPVTLQGVARAIEEMVPRLPDLVSREDVQRLQNEAGLAAPRRLLSLTGPRTGPVTDPLTGRKAQTEQFRYLILCHHPAPGVTTIEESRTDSKGRPINSIKDGAAARGSGFAYQWLLFSTANQAEFHFRYLGEQDIDDRKTSVIAFAQIPEQVKVPALFQSAGKQAAYFYQGILWVDRATSHIVLLRTDLLAPLKSLHLQQLTTELRFRAVDIRDMDATFWLPSEVHISIDQGNAVIEEDHRYSDYHLYHATARILPSP
jgi:hypothetical protein